MRYIILENHPNDSRVKIVENGICQTLSTRMGTGGGNVPLVLAIMRGGAEDSEGELDGDLQRHQRL